MPYTNVISRADAAPLLGKDQTDMATGQEAPSTIVLRARHVAAASATADTEEVVLGAAPWAATVTKVTYTPDTTQAGANTNSRTLNVNNKTQTLVPASLALVNAVNLTAFTAKVITLGNAANVAVTAADVLTLQSLHVGGSGLADTAGLIEVELTRNDAA